MARGTLTGRSPVGQITRRLPGGRRRRTPDLSGITRNLPKNLPAGRTAGTAGGVLLGAGAAVAASRVVGARRGEEAAESGNAEGTAKGTARKTAENAKNAVQDGRRSGQAALGKAKDTVGGALPGGKGGQGGGKKVKVTNIVEHIDIGAPCRLVYDRWTLFQDYPSFLKKVVSVDQEDETKLSWKAKIFWSSRTWDSTIIEQVPDQHIVWRSKGDKGHVDGTVSFHPLAPNLTRVLLVLEYHPQGFFERAGNLWRAQGRRVRLELKHFRRHVMTQALAGAGEVEGWRGEIRGSEVVRTHEEGLEDGGAEGTGNKQSRKPAAKDSARNGAAKEKEAAKAG